ncbi:MAG TPA: MarR family transcriptional regulator [Methylomusa anaerophila]|uniref:HTH-type transcriptional regulator MhqR n=1 Tax=Methylomusa anaerophila TaxID=1930071 RepID=A0A348AGL7_9FIRM|nr:MarR family transcriptional regulator [Methylomusa anaerophila]BBB90215.1 HTH-type transcriptional regulator MhqR [Methylomusa anaerophila]HML90731.1 MarR family transcriptional regulator [Methylomusa anaerophila]
MKQQTPSTPPSTRAQLGEALLQISDDILDTINDALKEYGISESKFSLLFLLYNTGTNQPLQPSEIADNLGIRRASVTKQLIWLEAHQLITRTICLEDQRMVNVTITEKGYQLLDLVLPHYWMACANLTNKLTEEETVCLLQLLIKIGL